MKYAILSIAINKIYFTKKAVKVSLLDAYFFIFSIAVAV